MEGNFIFKFIPWHKDTKWPVMELSSVEFLLNSLLNMSFFCPRMDQQFLIQVTQSYSKVYTLSQFDHWELLNGDIPKVQSMVARFMNYTHTKYYLSI